MREIPLTQGIVALIDDDDYALVSQFEWYARKHRRTHYATRNNPRPPRYSEQMHRLIMGLPRFVGEVDHINGIGYHNFRSNLRFATDAQSSQNKQRPKLTAVSRYKGVDFRKDVKRWRARICVHGRSIQIGIFGTELEAALAYDAAARRHFGPFACVNFAAQGERCALA